MSTCHKKSMHGRKIKNAIEKKNTISKQNKVDFEITKEWFQLETVYYIYSKQLSLTDNAGQIN